MSVTEDGISAGLTKVYRGYTQLLQTNAQIPTASVIVTLGVVKYDSALP